MASHAFTLDCLAEGRARLPTSAGGFQIRSRTLATAPSSRNGCTASHGCRKDAAATADLRPARAGKRTCRRYVHCAAANARRSASRRLAARVTAGHCSLGLARGHGRNQPVDAADGALGAVGLTAARHCAFAGRPCINAAPGRAIAAPMFPLRPHLTRGVTAQRAGRRRQEERLGGGEAPRLRKRCAETANSAK
jgi:hypothetical protein